MSLIYYLHGKNEIETLKDEHLTDQMQSDGVKASFRPNKIHPRILIIPMMAIGSIDLVISTIYFNLNFP